MATAARPNSAARATTCPGVRRPSEALVWACRSAPPSPGGRGGLKGNSSGPVSVTPYLAQHPQEIAAQDLAEGGFIDAPAQESFGQAWEEGGGHQARGG